MNDWNPIALRPEWTSKLQEDFDWAEIVESIQGNLLIVGERGPELHLSDFSGGGREDHMVKPRVGHLPEIIRVF